MQCSAVNHIKKSTEHYKCMSYVCPLLTRNNHVDRHWVTGPH